MDNIKTGAFIRELRKEKNMTQKELADLLHITDRAVSKWERGLCAPDISLLEPLALALGTTVTELISGERQGTEKYTDETDLAVKNIIIYSENETIFYKGIMPSEKVLDFPVNCNTLTGSVNL